MNSSSTSLTSLKSLRHRESGSATLIALGILSVTLLVLSTALIESSLRYRVGYQSQRWAKAGQAAEAGAEVALWTAQNWTGSNQSLWNTNGLAPNATTDPNSPNGTTGTITLNSLNSSTADVPATASVWVQTQNMGGNNWLRIRSYGSAPINGGTKSGRVLGIDTYDVLLRKLSLQGNKYYNVAPLALFPSPTLASAQSMRMVEVFAAPKSQYTMALLLANQLTMSGGSTIDSYDSTDSTKSTNGQYDPSKYQTNANVGIDQTNGKTDIGSQKIYGTLSYSGTTPANTGNVSGGLATPFNKTIPPVTAPTWTSYNANPTAVTGNATLTAGTQSSPAYYKLSTINLSGSNYLTIAPSGSSGDSYAQVWITGDLQTSGSSYIVLGSGVHVTFYVQGNVNISGGSTTNGMMNSAGSPADCVVNVVGSPSTSSTQSVTVSGSGSFNAAINAPGANYNISGSGVIAGSFIGNTMQISGGAMVHYDQSLAKLPGSGPGYGYTFASEVEAVR